MTKWLYRKNNGLGVWHAISRADFLDLATSVGPTWLDTAGRPTRDIKKTCYLYVGQTCIASKEEA